jgi:O-antigen/teichoic acid export membrane protein
LLLLPLGRPLVVLLLGERWLPAGIALMALCAWSAPRAAGSVIGESLKAAGRTDILPRLHLVQAVLAIVFMLAFLPFGLTGVAAGVAVGSVLAQGYALVRAARVLQFGRRAIVSALWPPYVAAAPMIAVVFLLDRLSVHTEAHGVAAGLALLVLEALLGVAVYLVSLAVLAPSTVAELRNGVRAIGARVGGSLGSQGSNPPSAPV